MARPGASAALSLAIMNILDLTILLVLKDIDLVGVDQEMSCVILGLPLGQAASTSGAGCTPNRSSSSHRPGSGLPTPTTFYSPAETARCR